MTSINSNLLFRVRPFVTFDRPNFQGMTPGSSRSSVVKIIGLVMHEEVDGSHTHDGDLNNRTEPVTAISREVSKQMHMASPQACRCRHLNR